jgi:hypothetical protein
MRERDSRGTASMFRTLRYAVLVAGAVLPGCQMSVHETRVAREADEVTTDIHYALLASYWVPELATVRAVGLPPLSADGKTHAAPEVRIEIGCLLCFPQFLARRYHDGSGDRLELYTIWAMEERSIGSALRRQQELWSLELCSSRPVLTSRNTLGGARYVWCKAPLVDTSAALATVDSLANIARGNAEAPGAIDQCARPGTRHSMPPAMEMLRVQSLSQIGALPSTVVCALNFNPALASSYASQKRILFAGEARTSRLYTW